MDEKLKPCPFCGGEARMATQEGRPVHHFVSCVNCLASSNSLIPHGDTKEDAIAAWNRRTPAETVSREVMTRDRFEELCVAIYDHGWRHEEYPEAEELWSAIKQVFPQPISTGEWSPEWENIDPAIVGWIPVACRRDEKTGIVSQWEVLGKMIPRPITFHPPVPSPVVAVPSVEELVGLPLLKDNGDWGGLKINKPTAQAIHAHLLATTKQAPDVEAEPSAGLLAKWAHNGEYTDLDREAEAFAANFSSVPNAASRGFYVGWKLALAALKNGGKP